MEKYGKDTVNARYIKTQEMFLSISDHIWAETSHRDNVGRLMCDVLDRHLRLQDITGVCTVGDFNRAVCEERAFDIINVSEVVQARGIAGLADAIEARGTVRVVLIAGPSSSGKTTFSKRLSIQLRAVGINPVPLSLDDYFVNRVDTPLDANGDYDFESLYAIDLPLFHHHLATLLEGGEVELPHYNFETGRREMSGQRMRLDSERSVLIIEGTHALNPELTCVIPDERKYRIFVSVFTGIALDETESLAPNDNRLLRRILRDSQFRGFSAEETIARWPSVRRGEDRWIFPFLYQADTLFNSSFLYELAVMKEKVEPILGEVKEGTPAYATAQRLMHCLDSFETLTDKAVPPTSLLREFFGGSSYKY